MRCCATMRCCVWCCVWCYVRWCAVRRCAMRWCAVCRCAMRWCAVWRSVATIVGAVDVMTMLGLIAAASMIVASMAMIDVAMFAPAVGVAPAGPWAHAQEDAVVEVIRSVKALGGAAVGCGFVIAPLTNGWNTNFDGNLRANHWRQGQARKQCCRTE